MPNETEQPEPVLCYVSGDFAYFTTRKLEDQWGDDWNDAPYDCNAGTPYDYGDHDKKSGVDPFEITKVGFFGFEEPWTPNRHYSVRDINKKAAPWLMGRAECGKYTHIYAGTTLSDFKKIVKENGGEIYIKEE